MTNKPGYWVLIRIDDGTRLCNFNLQNNIKLVYNQHESKTNPANLAGFLDLITHKVFEPTLNSVVHLMSTQVNLFEKDLKLFQVPKEDK